MDKIRAFSLIEMLVVMAILGILATAAIPAFNAVANGTNLNRAGQLVGDTILIARQEAVTKNRDVQVRFYYFTNGITKGWSGIQIWRVDTAATGTSVATAVTRMQMVPDGIIISSNTALSPLLTADPATSGSTNLPAKGYAQYQGFVYDASGAPETAVNDTNNFITLQSVHASGNPPTNYYTIQVSPVTGKTIVYRP